MLFPKTLMGINVNESSQHPFQLGEHYYYDKYASEN